MKEKKHDSLIGCRKSIWQIQLPFMLNSFSKSVIENFLQQDEGDTSPTYNIRRIDETLNISPLQLSIVSWMGTSILRNSTRTSSLFIRDMEGLQVCRHYDFLLVGTSQNYNTLSSLQHVFKLQVRIYWWVWSQFVSQD